MNINKMPSQKEDAPEYYIIVGTVKTTGEERVLPEHYEDLKSVRYALTWDLQAAPPHNQNEYKDGSQRPLTYKIYGIKNGQRVSVEETAD